MGIMEQPPMEKAPQSEKKPILERFAAMNSDQLVEYFQSIKTFSSESIINKMIEENNTKDAQGKSGITQETLRIAMRRIMTRVPEPSEVAKLLETIKDNK